MTRVVLYRGVAGSSAGLRVGQGLERNTTNGRQGKRPASGAAYVVGCIGYFTHWTTTACWRSEQFFQGFQRSERRRPCNSSTPQP